MTDSRKRHYSDHEVEKYIAGVSLYRNQMEQKLNQLSAELEKNREDAMRIETAFALLGGDLVEASFLYRDFLDSPSDETSDHFHDKIFFIFDEVIHNSWLGSFIKSHPCVAPYLQKLMHSTTSTSAKVGFADSFSLPQPSSLYK